MITYVSVRTRSPILLIASEEPTAHDSVVAPLLTKRTSTVCLLI